MTDAERFEAFVRGYQDMVFATAVRLLGNPSEAEDVAQTVFLRAFQRFGEVGRREAAGGWLKTVTRNECLNHLSRYRARWRFFSELPATGGEDPAGVGGDDGQWLASIDRAEAHGYLERAVAALPDHQRVPLVLFHFEEMSYQDIAATLGVSLGKVKTDIHRGRLALRQRMVEHGYGPR